MKISSGNLYSGYCWPCLHIIKEKQASPKNGHPYRKSLFPLLAPLLLRGGRLAVPGGHDGLPLRQRGDAPPLLPELVREDLGLVAVGPLLEVGALLGRDSTQS